MGSPPLLNYLGLRSKQLRLDLEAATLFTGTTGMGDVAEDAIRRFLKSSLSARYSVGIGEVISVSSQANNQTYPKDVIIFDADFSPVFGWGETGSHLFPIESVYAILEVKKTVDSAELLKGVKQATEARRLGGEDFARPFTAVIAFDSDTQTETLAKKIYDLPVEERVDFILILNPMLSKEDKDVVGEGAKSDYIAHWHYETPGVGGGPIRFVSAYDAYSESKKAPTPPHVYLTWGRSEHALMWSYLFLISSINAMGNQTPDLWKYAEAIKINLGYKGDSSGW
jgi:Domain of unknown function (DUF6602)